MGGASESGHTHCWSTLVIKVSIVDFICSTVLLNVLLIFFIVSGPPTSIKILNITMTTITLSWRPPECPGGTVQGYQVTVNGSVHNTLPWQHTLQIINLSLGSKYAVAIQAMNGAGGGEPFEFFINTLAPGESIVQSNLYGHCMYKAATSLDQPACMHGSM